MLNIPVICINDSNKPNDIPTSKWVTKGKEYTITKILNMVVQGNIIGVELAEIDLRDCAPYRAFALSRFGIIVESDKEEVNNKVKELEDEKI